MARPGDTVRLRFELGMDACSGNTAWYVDDVCLYTCENDVPLCGATPRSDCKTALGRSTLSVTDRADDACDRLKWTWAQGEATTLVELGDPLTADAYALCIWDGRAGMPELVTAAEVPPGAGWVRIGATGVRYANPKGTVAGVTQIRVRSGATGKPSIAVAAKGAALGLAPPASAAVWFAADPAVTAARLQGGHVLADDVRRDRSQAQHSVHRARDARATVGSRRRRPLRAATEVVPLGTWRGRTLRASGGAHPDPTARGCRPADLAAD